MKLRCGALLLVAGLTAVGTMAWADDLKSGPQDKIGGPFQVKAITGDNAKKELCYV